jgi:hypothetical protein
MHPTDEASVPAGAKDERRRGAILGVVLVVLLVVSIMGAGLLTLASQNAVMAARALNTTKAFWLAEAGVQRFDQRCISHLKRNSIGETAFGGGSYRVDAHLGTSTSRYAIVTGTVQGESQQIRVDVVFQGRVYEHAVFAGNEGTNNYVLDMRGTGNPVAYTWPNGDPGERGGKDIVNGKVYANGDVNLYDQSMVSNAPLPNTYNVLGDVDATGEINLTNSARIYGSQTEHVPQKSLPVFPDYAQICTYNVSAEFASRGITSGYLPASHPLRNVVVKNPSNRSAECNSTAGDDYFFEPIAISGSGTWKTAPTPLNLGNNQIYYVDGHVWFNSHSTYGFRVSGYATIASSANIHVSDNLDYADPSSSMLVLVAVGKPDLLGNIQNGNVYFGDPEFGTLYSVDAFMFARKDFLYNTSSNTGRPGEPESGFQVFGNYGALGVVKINRDWYGATANRLPAVYDAVSGRWRDLSTGVVVTNSITHYQMIINYDERIRDPNKQPPGLPQLGEGDVSDPGIIYSRIVKWDAAPFDS